MHPVRRAKWTVDRSYEALKPWIQHLHVHDGGDRADKLEYLAMGTGEIDTRRAIQLLKGDAFDGYLSGEWIRWEPYEVHLPRELHTMKEYEAQA
jgi:sugar phosphate isomerase/epimerase